MDGQKSIWIQQMKYLADLFSFTYVLASKPGEFLMNNSASFVYKVQALNNVKIVLSPFNSLAVTRNDMAQVPTDGSESLLDYWDGTEDSAIRYAIYISSSSFIF